MPILTAHNVRYQQKRNRDCQRLDSNEDSTISDDNYVIRFVKFCRRSHIPASNGWVVGSGRERHVPMQLPPSLAFSEDVKFELKGRK